MRVAVVGGTGLVGRHVVRELGRRGQEPVPLARSTGVDVRTGRGLDPALEGCSAVVDASNVVTVRAGPAVDFFSQVTRRLLAAEARAGVRHHVVLSIVGIDGSRYGYYQGKLAQEELALSAAVPATVQRATQFHEFAGQVLDRGRRGPVVVCPRMLVQPVAAAEVGAVLAELASGPPQGRAADLAGPQPRRLADCVRALLHARGQRGVVVGVPLPGLRGAAAGALLAGPGARLGTLTFDDWLAAGGDDDAAAPRG